MRFHAMIRNGEENGNQKERNGKKEKYENKSFAEKNKMESSQQGTK